MRTARRPGLSLARIFGIGLAAAALLLATHFAVLHASSRAAIVDVTARLGTAAAREVARRTEERFRAASAVIGEFQAEVAAGAVLPQDPDAVAAALTGAALRRTAVAEVAFSWGRLAGRDGAGGPVLAPGDRGQVAVFRTREGALAVRRTRLRDGRFVAETRQAGRAGPVEETAAEDPTAHATFRTPATATFAGRLLWSDLHRSQLDAGLPEDRRRITVSAQRALETGDRNFLGVVRVSLATDGLDAIARMRLEEEGGGEDLVFLCDRAGRLVAPTGGARLEDTDDGLRVPCGDVPDVLVPALDAALRADLRGGRAIARVVIGGRPWIVSLRDLPASQDWIVGVLVPEDAFTGALDTARTRLLVGAVAIAGLLLGGGLLGVRAAGRSFGAIVDATARMGSFDFAPAPRTSHVQEVQAVLDGLESAKGALRALGKFVPVDLVRRLYAEGGDPRPGGELRELSVLFSDIAGFTSLAETVAPDELAEVLSRYFAAMTAAIHGTRGTVDKFIGDAVMALWNAPEDVPEHAAAACRAALACRSAERALLEDPAWGARPRFRTRFGIHTGRVLVGNIGAPDRLDFTALGDGVNLASRLEGLNKQYGTTILVSEATAAAAGSAFAFRRIDVVAVKGRARGVAVLELLGPAGVRTRVHDDYERAFARYLARDFAAARELLGAQADDPPSRVLADRCTAFLLDPPDTDWDGTFTAAEK